MHTIHKLSATVKTTLVSLSSPRYHQQRDLVAAALNKKAIEVSQIILSLYHPPPVVFCEWSYVSGWVSVCVCL